MSLTERIAAKTFYTGDCIIWTGCLNSRRYGQIYVKDKGMQLIHRVAYKLHYGELSLPDDVQLDHLCRTTQCFNPGHLEAVNQSINMKRAYRDNPRLKLTHCRKGHLYTDTNIILNHGCRQCRICYNKWQMGYRQKKAQRR